MDYPALIIPVTKVDPTVDTKTTRESFWSEEDEVVHNMCKCRGWSTSSKRNAKDPLDDPEAYKGLPVGIQLVGPTLQEEVVLGVGRVVDAALKLAQKA